MAVNHIDRVGAALDLVAAALDRFITEAVADRLPEGKDWTFLLDTLDAQKGNNGRAHSRFDVAESLRVLTDNVPRLLNRDWEPFKDKLSRPDQALATELKDVRNRWAHRTAFSEDDAYRALDTAERLLTAVGAPAAAAKVKSSRMQLRRLSAERQDLRVTTPTATVTASGLKPWREVVQPHRDVRGTGFSAAEFQANLYDVAFGNATDEYKDPAAFFGRTYLTDGLRELLADAVRRVLGDRGAKPVRNLQTTFGGGKTHSMLSLWHLFSGVPLRDLPQELHELATNAGAGERLSARRVAISGIWLKPGEVDVKLDGTRVHTIWGELAWQLGGAAGYSYVQAADENRQNPGEALRRLLAAYSPAVILIDEWVAYARELVGRDDSVGGTFESQFTFAQALTEAAAATPGVLLVVSIPASSDATRDDDVETSGLENEEEVGGRNGVVALQRLQNVVRRVADQWRAASGDESFEIVKRRLFEPADAEALAHIGMTARGMVDLYRKHRDEFPSEVSDNEYADRIRRSYPVHPELFDRLYEDWSTLDRFQRTRGVLRLMNHVVHALWASDDASPLIMPGSVPLGVHDVVTEVTQYVEDRFKAVVAADVEGPTSSPRAVDEANRATLGARHVTQRIARTIFMGATPTLKTANRGLDRRRVFLGTALPGDVPGNFHSALGQLGDRSTYLYSAGTSYWFDTQVSMARTARDHAEQLHPEDLVAEVAQRLQPERRSDPRGFAAVHLTDDPAQVPENDEVHLVVLPLRHTHDKKAGETSSAMAATKQLVDTRGGGQRQHRNLVVTLAADATRAAEVQQAVRDYLGWRFVVDHADTSLDLTKTQKNQAVERMTRADQTVTARIRDAYIWALVPTAVPGAPYTLRAVRADTTTTSVVARATQKLLLESELAVVHAANLVRQQVNKIPTVWQDGHLSVDALWDLYATHPYLPRLRDRAVLGAGVADALNHPIAWEQGVFALADSYDAAAGRYVGLRLPGDDDALLAVTGSTLLVRPDAAMAQREADLAAAQPAAAPDDVDIEVDGTVSVPPALGTPTWTGGRATGTGPTSSPAPVTAKRRFFGSRTLRSERPAADFLKIQEEVLARLTALPGVTLTVRLEVSAELPSGFDDATVRTVGENARTLRFDQSGFSED